MPVCTFGTPSAAFCDVSTLPFMSRRGSGDDVLFVTLMQIQITASRLTFVVRACILYQQLLAFLPIKINKIIIEK